MTAPIDPATVSPPPLPDLLAASIGSPQSLIESSRPQPRVSNSVHLFPLTVMLVLLIAWPSGSGAVAAARAVLVPLVLIAAAIVPVLLVRRQAARIVAEGRAVELLEELAQLRRWPEAAAVAGRVLAGPMFSGERRMRSLMTLAAVLQRYHRFEEARAVHEYLLDPPPGDPTPDASTAHAVRIARAMTLLREDYLIDADRAMNELRRDVNRARDEARRRRRTTEAAGEADSSALDDATQPQPEPESAGLLLLDLYRDVKTNHIAEAIELFESRRRPLREQLGHRLGDALVLAAAAYDAAGRTGDAAAAYADATRLVPAMELHRRYPETSRLPEKYAAAEMPGTRHVGRG